MLRTTKPSCATIISQNRRVSIHWRLIICISPCPCDSQREQRIALHYQSKSILLRYKPSLRWHSSPLSSVRLCPHEALFIRSAITLLGFWSLSCCRPLRYSAQWHMQRLLGIQAPRPVSSGCCHAPCNISITLLAHVKLTTICMHPRPETCGYVISSILSRLPTRALPI